MFIVAEIGVNWDGDINLAKEMISKAKEFGCNAVKFQSFNEENLNNHPQSSRLLKSSISKDNIESINNLARSIGIEWFCTPMYDGAVDMLEPYVRRFKVRVTDGKPLLGNKMTNLLEKIFKSNKEIIVSSESSPKNCHHYQDARISWLYCVPKYPCSISDLDFSKIRDFDGYSNHYPHFLAPLSAAILGAKIIEIHMTSDKTRDFVDNSVSFDYNELAELVKLIRLSEELKR